MIKIYGLYNGSTTEITPFAKTINLSASKDQPSRKLEATIAYPIYDPNQPKIQVCSGYIIWIVDDVHGEIFRGMVIDREIDSDTEELTFTAYDFMYHLLKSKASYNFQNVTPEQAVYIVCGDVGIATGTIATTGIPINHIVKGKSLYNIIMECYTEASEQNNKQYIPIMQIDKLSVIEKGQIVAGYTLKVDVNVTSIKYKDSIENMVNKVNIYDSNGNYVSNVENTDWINQFGVFQDDYEISKDKDTNTAANNMLYGLDTDITVDGLGNVNCITGYGVACQVFYLSTMQNATLFIDTDSHTWDMKNGGYTMELTLSISNLMDADYSMDDET
jgi:hypothetical protein